MREQKRRANPRSLGTILKKIIMIAIVVLLSSTLFIPMESKLNAKIVIEDDETASGSTPVVVPGSSSSGSTSGSTSNVTYSTNLMVDWTCVSETTAVTTSYFKKFCTGAISWAANLAIQNLTSLIISSDIDGLSDLLLLVQSPQVRSELQHKALVKQIAQMVSEIMEGVQNIQNQLDELTEELRKYETAAAYERAAISLRDTYQKYITAWTNYQSVLIAVQNLNDLEDKYPEETRTDAQKLEIENANKNMEVAISMFIKGIEEGSGFQFLTDIQNLPSYLWNPSNPTSTYLGAYEAFLRERYTFEHQIVDSMRTAIEACVDMNTQMLVLYAEYMGYKKKLAEDQGDYTTYADYTPAYFSNVETAIVKNLNAMVESIGIGYYLVADELTAEEIAAAKEINPNFVKPETIEYKVKISGTTYDAYRVRDNKSLAYYIILKKSFTTNSLVKQYVVTEDGNGYARFIIYRPNFMLDGLYTDNGQFRMISSMDELTFIKSSWTDLRKELREEQLCGLSGISSNINRVLLYTNEFDEVGRTSSYGTYTMRFSSNNLSDKNIEEATSRNVLESKFYQALVIYRDIVTDMNYKDNKLIINDVASLNGKTIHISGGQTLDITALDKNPSNVTIFVTGSGTIKSSSKITLNSSNIIIANTESDYVVNLENVNINAAKCSEAALKIMSPCTVNMVGTCNFIGTKSFDDINNYDLYKNYTRTRPIYACHGILIEGNVTLQGGAKVTATGATGGAGICLNKGNLTIESLTLNATGSTAYRSVICVGSAIGACVSYDVARYIPQAVFKRDYDYIPKNLIVNKGDSTKNGAGSLYINNSTVTVSSPNRSSGDVEIDEIGGIKMTVGAGTSTDAEETRYYCLKDGKITNSSITLQKAHITSRIDTTDVNNIYNPEQIQITAYTAGKSGPTTKGISFKLFGDKGESDWIEADEIGNDDGSTTQTVIGRGVGKISKVSFKTNSGNGWYPQKIEINCLQSGNSISLYGGRWIYDEEVTLNPKDNVYDIHITTGTEDGAGTDSDIYVQLRDNNGLTTEKVYLSEISQYSDAFEKGDTDIFYVYVPSDFNECTQVLFYSDHSNANADWLLDKFVIKKVQGENDDSGFTYYAGQWFTEDKTLCFGKNSGSSGQFYLEVKTADKNKAGTDSNIWLTIYGTIGNTEAVNITKYAGDGNNFERGDKDCFNVAYEYANIGTINKIVIYKDNDGSGPDWWLDYITITEKASYGKTTQSVTFNIDKEIEDKSYTFDSSYMKKNTRQSIQTLNREILSSIEKNTDGSYSLDACSNITISEEAFALISESKVIFTLNMKNEEDKLLYSVTFDGSKFESNNSLEFKSGYSSNNGNAIIDFLSKAALPAGTVLKINTSQFGFPDNESICVLQKGEDGWTNEIEVSSVNGILTLDLKEGKQLLLKNHNSSLPLGYETEPSSNNTWLWIALSGVVLVITIVVVVCVKLNFRRKQKSKVA